MQKYSSDVILTMHVCLQIPEQTKLEIAKRIASGVQFMHSRNPVIIHQDIKPLNIMVR